MKGKAKVELAKNLALAQSEAQARAHDPVSFLGGAGERFQPSRKRRNRKPAAGDEHGLVSLSINCGIPTVCRHLIQKEVRGNVENERLALRRYSGERFGVNQRRLVN